MARSRSPSPNKSPSTNSHKSKKSKHRSGSKYNNSHNKSHKSERKRRYSVSSKSSNDSLSPRDRHLNKRLHDSLKKLKKLDDEERRAEMEKFKVLRQKELENKVVEDDMSKKIESEVDRRLKDLLEKHNLDVEAEVKRKVEIIKKMLEDEMHHELQKRIAALDTEVENKSALDRVKIEELQRTLIENNRKIEEAQKKLAEERLQIIEDHRKLLEEKQKLEEYVKKKEKDEQMVILNKGKAVRPKLSFSFKGPN